MDGSIKLSISLIFGSDAFHLYDQIAPDLKIADLREFLQSLVKSVKGELTPSPSGLSTSRSVLSVASKASTKSSTLAKVAALASFTHRPQTASHLLPELGSNFRIKSLNPIDEVADVSRLSSMDADVAEDSLGHPQEEHDAPITESGMPAASENLVPPEDFTSQPPEPITPPGAVGDVQSSRDKTEPEIENQKQNEASSAFAGDRPKEPRDPPRSSLPPSELPSTKIAKTGEQSVPQLPTSLTRDQQLIKRSKERVKDVDSLTEERLLIHKSLSEITK